MDDKNGENSMNMKETDRSKAGEMKWKVGSILRVMSVSTVIGR